MEKSILVPSKLWYLVLLIVILVLGLGTRLYDLTDPPLDFASTRQLRSALIARGMYYTTAENVPEWQQEIAAKQGRHSMIEPTVLESIVAGTYHLVGGEYVWIARIYSSLFWVLGGIALFFLVEEMVSTDGAFFALIYYLFTPFGISASRAFQPDPLLTSLIVFSWWTFYRWYRSSSWKWALLAGLLAGAAMYVKSTAVFFLLPAFFLLVLTKEPIGKLIKNKQVWSIAALSGIPVLAYHVYGVFIVGSLAQQFKGRFFPEILKDAQYYIKWKNALSSVSGHNLILVMALIGLVLYFRNKKLWYLGGIGIGYVLYCFFFTYHITTHYYYHLPMIPVIALLLAGFYAFIAKFLKHKIFSYFLRFGLIVLLLVGVGGGYYLLHQEDHRNEPYYYEKVAGFVEKDAKVVSISQDYGNRIAFYGWIIPKQWKSNGDVEYIKLTGGTEDPFLERFEAYTSGYDYFLVTSLNQLRKQEDLYNHLNDHFTVHVEGGGYIIYDLNQKK
jgi:4-amino-4-deoxy-L-arabinose transferase-like glycosyltransferase